MSDDLFGEEPGQTGGAPDPFDDDLFGPIGTNTAGTPSRSPDSPGEQHDPQQGRSGVPRILLLGALLILAGVVGTSILVLRAQPQSEDAAPTPAPAASLPGSHPASPDATSSAAPQPAPTSDSPAPTTGLVVDVSEAEQALASLPVKGRAPKTGYDRDRFGAPWRDVDDNGCDTRNDILRRDLVDIELRDDCTVESGTLVDPFSRDTVPFQRGFATSAEVQIDHLVPLSNAWQTGAQQLTQDQRVAFANDPANLLAVRGDLNLQKSDGDAATWLPPDKSFRCQYVAMQVLVKQRHGLWLTAPEKAAIERVLGRC